MITKFKLFEGKQGFAIGDIVESSYDVFVIVGKKNGEDLFECNKIAQMYNNLVFGTYIFTEMHQGIFLNFIEKDYVLNDFYYNLPDETINHVLKEYNIDLRIQRDAYIKEQRKKTKIKDFNL